MKKTLKKIDRFLIKLFFFGLKKRSRKISEQIVRRGPDHYSDYSPEFIYNSVIDAIQFTPVIVMKPFLRKNKPVTFRGRVLKYPMFWARLFAPDAYFDKVIHSLIASFSIRKSEFDKLGRNDKIIVRVKDSGAKVQIKKKNFDPDKHYYLKIVSNDQR